MPHKLKLSTNLFNSPQSSRSTPRGSAGYDNARENIDPHIKTKVINSKEGSIEHIPTNDNHIVNKKYVDDQLPVTVTHASTTGQTVNDHHDESHTHTHASNTGITAGDHHAQTHTVVSHDTDTTGAELTSLADNSMADTLHRHSELSASDGSPDQALTVDAAGNIIILNKLTLGDDLDVPGFFSHTAATLKTISSGVITADRTYHAIGTQSAASTDDLDTINGGTEGDIIILRASHSAQTVVVKSRTGNIYLDGNVDFSLDHSRDRITLMKQSTWWVEMSRSNNF